MEQEIWKSIIGYDGYYEVSNLGRVKSLAKEWCRSDGRIIGRRPDSILKDGGKIDGYRNVILCVNKVKKTLLVHRLVALHFLENELNLPQVNHKNSIRFDNRVENLEWVTESENAIHGFAVGNREGQFGKNNPMTKITEEQVIEIREKHKTGNFYQWELAELYNIAQSHVHRIVTNKRWTYIN